MSEKASRVVWSSITFVLLFLVLANTSCKRPGIGYNQGYEPEQPIPYDHALHAGKFKINCQYCHANAGRDAKATVPSLNICMNCHNQIKTSSDSIAKVRKAWQDGGSIQWIRVNMLPDFVKFNHQRHINAGKSCQECHGPVETMKVLRQYPELSMGWCVECHRKPENNASLNCTTCHH